MDLFETLGWALRPEVTNKQVCLNCDEVVYNPEIYQIDNLGKHYTCPECGCICDVE